MPKCRRCPDPSLLALLMLAASVPVVSFQPCRVARVAGLGPGRGETRRTALSCDAGQRQSPQAPAGGVVPPEIAELRGAVAAVKKMKSVRCDTLNHTCRPGKPTYRRLFTHQTWNEHLGGSTFSRWIKCVKGVPYSVIVRATWKSVVFMMAYTLVVSQVLPCTMASTASKAQLPFSFCGSAIGLLLVFRTNNAYQRLDDARGLWAELTYVVHEIASLVAASEGQGEPKEGGSDGHVPKMPTRDVVNVHRYLVALVWALRDELREEDARDDILRLLIVDEQEELWISSSASRPRALMNQLRRKLHAAWHQERLAAHTIFLLDGQVKELGRLIAGCQRIFSSPIPPTMSRHGLRCLLLWLLALPVVLTGSVPPLVNVAWTAAMAFIYLGIDELGVQVEQPFQIIPLWQICQAAQDAVVDTLASPERPLLPPAAGYQGAS